MIELYGYPLSPPSEAVRIGLVEKQLPFKLTSVDLTGKENRSPLFRDKNYLGQIPVLQDGPITVFESNVILEYLEEAYPVPRLLPSDLALRAEIRQWIAILQVNWHSIRHEIYHEGLLKPLKLLPGPGDRKRLMVARKAMIPHLDALEQRLTQSQSQMSEAFLVGDYSLADVLYTPTLYILKKADVITKTYKQVNAWTQRCLSRKSAPTWLDNPSGLPRL